PARQRPLGRNRLGECKASEPSAETEPERQFELAASLGDVGVALELRGVDVPARSRSPGALDRGRRTPPRECGCEQGRGPEDERGQNRPESRRPAGDVPRDRVERTAERTQL